MKSISQNSQKVNKLYRKLNIDALLDSTILVSGHGSGTIQLWDVTTGNKIAALDGHTQEVETLKFSPDGETLVSTAQDGTIFLWDWDEAITGASSNDE